MAQMPMQGQPGAEPIKYADEDEELLFGPTTRPDDTMQAGARGAMIRRPKQSARYMADLVAAAESPDAPQELQDMIRVLQYHMGGK